MGVLTIYSSVTAARAVATEANTETVVDGVAYLAAPHALLRVASALLSDPIADGSADLLDPHGRERRGNVEGRINMMLKASQCVSSGEAGRTPIEHLSLNF